MAVFAATKTTGTTALFDVAADTKKTGYIALPTWFSMAILYTSYASGGLKTGSRAIVRLRRIKG
jgi:uncharacterized membrane protein YhdT